MLGFWKKTLYIGITLGIFSSIFLWTAPGVIAAPDGFEENDSIDKATEITAGYYSGLTIEPTDDVDYYNITLPAGANISVTILNMTEGRFDLSLSDTTGVVQNSSSAGGGNSERVWWFNVPVTGNYTIRVASSDHAVGPYDMRIEAPIIDDAFEANDDFVSATAIDNRSTSYNLQLYDNDYYVTHLDAGEYLNATILLSPAERCPDEITFSLYNSSQDLIYETSIDFPTNSSTICIQAGTSDDEFFVVVGVGAGAAWGNYTLILQDVTDDAYEDDDTPSTAEHVNINDISSLYALYSTGISRDDDYYQFEMNAGDAMWAFCYPLGHNLTLQITDGTGAVLASGAIVPGTPNPLVNYTVPTSGAYYIHVSPPTLMNSPRVVLSNLIVGRLNVTHPADITYQFGQSGNNISWYVNGHVFATFFDATTYMAKIYRDGVKVTDTFIVDLSQTVTWSVDDLPVGTYTFKIIVYDMLGMVVEDTVRVTVQTKQNSDDGIPGYPVILIAGFTLVAITALAIRRHRMSFVK